MASYDKPSVAAGILSLAGAAICFGMFFGFGPTPEHQLVPVFGVVCLFCAYVCFSGARRHG